jgi:hypothetical protein
MLFADNLPKEEAAMGGFMTGSQFGVKAGWRVGIFLALTIGFPFIVYGLVIATGARGVGGAVGALAVVAGIFLKPIILLGFVISLLSPCWQRMRSLGLPGFFGLLAPLLFLLDWPYLVVAGTHWGVGFSLGILKLNVPLFAITALAMLIAMALASPPDDDLQSQRVVVRICGILAIALFATALLTGGASLWVMGNLWFMPPGGKPTPIFFPATLGYLAMVIKPFVCVAFCMAMAAMVYLSRRASSGDSPGGSESDGGQPRSPPSASSGRVVFGRR